MDLEYYSAQKNFTAIENQVLSYISQHKNSLKDITIQKIADETFTSTSTIFRLAKKLGFKGFTDMIYHLTRQVQGDSSVEITQYLSGLSTSIENIFQRNDENLQLLIERIGKKEGALYILGTGYSGIIGEYLYKKILGKGELVYYSNGSDTNALFLNNLHRISDMICISKSGETELINSKAETAKSRGVGVISFTHSLDNSLAKLSDIAFVIDDNQFLDRNNINATQFYSLFLLYLEYVIEKSF